MSSEPTVNVTTLHNEAPDQPVTFRAPPHNLEAEMALLGAVLANNRAYEHVQEFLHADHFADPAHRRIYAAATTLIDRGQLASPVTLKNYLENDGALAEIDVAEA